MADQQKTTTDSEHFSPYRADGKLVSLQSNTEEIYVLIHATVWLCVRCDRSSASSRKGDCAGIGWYVVPIVSNGFADCVALEGISQLSELFSESGNPQ